MEPLITLYEREQVDPNTLPVALATLYNGGLAIPEGTETGRPYLFANFVESIDGVVSYNAPGQLGGGMISGGKEQDKMVMGLLRARADAVIFGSSSLRADANHPRTPGYIYRPLTTEYDRFRAMLGRQSPYPLTVVMTASGQIDLHDRTFAVPGLHAVIITTAKGRDYLLQKPIPASVEVQVIEEKQAEGGISPSSVLKLLTERYNVRVALYEGGPTLLASFLKAQLVDELFLTFSPQIVGRTQEQHRLSLVEGYAFSPDTAPWSTLLSVKLADNHLLLRYKFTWNKKG